MPSGEVPVRVRDTGEMTSDDLCNPVETTTWGDGVNRHYLCADCGVEAWDRPPPRPVCFVKGGRRTDGASP